MQNASAGMKEAALSAAGSTAVQPAAVFPLGFFLFTFAVSWGLWALPVAAAHGLLHSSWVDSSTFLLLVTGASAPLLGALLFTAFTGRYRQELGFTHLLSPSALHETLAADPGGTLAAARV